MTSRQTIAVTGASGRLGRLLRLVWQDVAPEGLVPLWLGRGPTRGPEEQSGDLLLSPPVLPEGAIILHLAGATARPVPDHADHVALARAVAGLADRCGARHLFLASSAAVYGAAPDLHTEEGPTVPLSPYGRAKLAAEAVVAERAATTVLRIGNVAGADALLGRRSGHITLDPVPGTDRGPIRSYIGPASFARTLIALAGRAASGSALPQRLNIAQSPPVAMADLLDAADRGWSWGPPNPSVIPAVALSTRRLDGLLPALGPTTPQRLVQEWRSLPRWSA